MSSSPKGWSTQEKDDRLKQEFATVEPIREKQHGLSVMAHTYVRVVGTDAAEAGSTTDSIVATGHAALAGDVIRFTSGNLSGQEVKVAGGDDLTANAISLAEALSEAPAATDAFQILRHKYPIVNADGSLAVSVTEEATVADGGALPALVKVVAGYDGSAVQVLKVNAAGELVVASKTVVDKARLDYGTTSVGTGAYVELIASTGAAASKMTLFDAGGYAMILAIGAAASEVDYIYIPPGGFNGEISVTIPAGSRLSLKCLESGITVSVGQIVLNLLN
jgi:hypothetical protein